VPQGGVHFKLVRDLADVLDRHFEARKDVYVAGDLKMLWGIPGLSEPAPDVAVIFGVPRELEPTTFDVVEEGALPALVIEVVSSTDSKTRENDYEKKVEIYQRAGVPEYLILDPPHVVTQGRLLISGYRLGADEHYHDLEPDAQGRLLSETTQLLFGVDDDGSSLVVIDASTGERLRTSSELQEALKAETAARQAADERASREAAARQAADERAARDTEARQAAEAELMRLKAELDRARRRGD